MTRRRVPLVLVTLIVAVALIETPSVEAEPIPARPGVVRESVWHLKTSLTSGFADSSFRYGRADDFPVMGDWDGDGVKTPGVVRGNEWHLRNDNSSGFADIVFAYGSVTDIPIAGDWDGDGTDTPGVVRIGSGNGGTSYCGSSHMSWRLRNSNTSGVADETFAFRCGHPLSHPLVGDWDGDGDDTPGVYTSSVWLLNNGFDDTEEVGFGFGSGVTQDFPIVGDWDGDEHESAGVIRGNTCHLKNENSNGFADTSFLYGTATDLPVIWGEAP